MSAWNKIKFFWDNIFGIVGGTLTASSTATGYDKANIHNGLEVNSWKATSAADQWLRIDTYSASTTANALVVHGHNLGTVSADLSVWYSTTGAWAGEQVAAKTATAITSDNTILFEFAEQTARYWGIFMSGSMTAAPEIQNAVLCNKTELDYASTSFDPHGQTAVSEVNITQGGYVSGIFTSHIEREMSLAFQAADAALYAKVKDWWERNGMKQFFVAYETANSPNDVFLMRPDGKFNNPLTNGGAYRDITINLKGRKA